MLVTLKQGLDSTSFTHTNDMVETVNNERQFQKHVTYNAKGITYRDEWIGTSDKITELLCSKVPNINSYDWTENESWVIDGLKGDLYKLTHTYYDEIQQTDEPEEGSDEPGSVADSIEDSVGVNPWTITSETTDIGAIDYYILKFRVSTADQEKIIRDRIALWEQSPYEEKEQFKYVTSKQGYITVDKEPDNGNIDSPITLAIVKWIVDQKRQQFPLTSVRVRHEYIVNGPSYKKGVINKNSLAKELAKTNSELQFPSKQFGRELKAIPDCPYQFDFSYPTRFMLTDWNIQILDQTGKYLITKEYISYPAAFPLPLDPTPGD